MPSTRTAPYNLVATVTPIVSAASTEELGVEIDHLCLFIDFTLGSLTSLDIDLQFSLDGSTWKDAYAADKSQITLNLAATFAGAIYLGVGASANTKMQPAAIAAPVWRLNMTTNGTTTSSSIKIDAIPFVMGALRD